MRVVEAAKPLMAQPVYTSHHSERVLNKVRDRLFELFQKSSDRPQSLDERIYYYNSGTEQLTTINGETAVEAQPQSNIPYYAVIETPIDPINQPIDPINQPITIVTLYKPQVGTSNDMRDERYTDQITCYFSTADGQLHERTQYPGRSSCEKSKKLFVGFIGSSFNTIYTAAACGMTLNLAVSMNKAREEAKGDTQPNDAMRLANPILGRFAIPAVYIVLAMSVFKLASSAGAGKRIAQELKRPFEITFYEAARNTAIRDGSSTFGVKAQLVGNCAAGGALAVFAWQYANGHYTDSQPQDQEWPTTRLLLDIARSDFSLMMPVVAVGLFYAFTAVTRVFLYAVEQLASCSSCAPNFILPYNGDQDRQVQAAEATKSRASVFTAAQKEMTERGFSRGDVGLEVRLQAMVANRRNGISHTS